jgi:hypothetical protein
MDYLKENKMNESVFWLWFQWPFLGVILVHISGELVLKIHFLPSTKYAIHNHFHISFNKITLQNFIAELTELLLLFPNCGSPIDLGNNCGSFHL